MWPFYKKDKQKEKIDFEPEDPKNDITDDEHDTIKDYIKKSNNRVDGFIKKFKDLEVNDKKLAETFKFEYKERKTPSGRLIDFGDVTINMDYVTNISVSNVGDGADIYLYESGWYGSRNYRTLTFSSHSNASIEITYVSGKTTSVYCNTHVIEQVYSGLLKAWRKS